MLFCFAMVPIFILARSQTSLIVLVSNLIVFFAVLVVLRKRHHKLRVKLEDVIQQMNVLYYSRALTFSIQAWNKSVKLIISWQQNTFSSYQNQLAIPNPFSQQNYSAQSYSTQQESSPYFPRQVSSQSGKNFTEEENLIATNFYFGENSNQTRNNNDMNDNSSLPRNSNDMNDRRFTNEEQNEENKEKTATRHQNNSKTDLL